MMQLRHFGNTTEAISIVGFGGIVVMGEEQGEADRRVREAFDRGVNYFDVAPSYGDAEERLGPALVGLRDQVFLACKTGKRTKEEAAAELRLSLRNLRTDRFDLYQLHALSSVEEVETCFGPGGAMEAFIEARNAGMVRFLGFSAHSVEAALLALERFPFDSVLFPFNYTTWYAEDFGPQVMEAAQKRGAARLALKSMARRPWPEGAEKTHTNCWYEPHTDPAEAALALRWTLSLPITAAIPPGDYGLFRLAMDVAERFTPLSVEEMREVEIKARREPPIFSRAA
jgi:aryl-alcohol dehydrogenase-like predicted oxidoreductase